MQLRLLVTWTAIACAATLAACGQEPNKAADAAKKAATEAAEKTKEAAAKAAEAAKEATKEAATKAADATSQAATQAADATKQAATQAADATKDAAAKAVGAAKDAAAPAQVVERRVRSSELQQRRCLIAVQPVSVRQTSAGPGGLERQVGLRPQSECQAEFLDGPAGIALEREDASQRLVRAGLPDGRVVALGDRVELLSRRTRLRRIVGRERGYAVTGALGGLVSSTAVTWGFARSSRDDEGLRPAYAAGVVAACTVLVPRVAVVTLALNRDVGVTMLPYLAAPFLAGLVFTWWAGRTRAGDLPAGAALPHGGHHVEPGRHRPSPRRHRVRGQPGPSQVAGPGRLLPRRPVLPLPRRRRRRPSTASPSARA